MFKFANSINDDNFYKLFILFLLNCLNVLCKHSLLQIHTPTHCTNSSSNTFTFFVFSQSSSNRSELRYVVMNKNVFFVQIKQNYFTFIIIHDDCQFEIDWIFNSKSILYSCHLDFNHRRRPRSKLTFDRSKRAQRHNAVEDRS